MLIKTWASVWTTCTLIWASMQITSPGWCIIISLKRKRLQVNIHPKEEVRRMAEGTPKVIYCRLTTLSLDIPLGDNRRDNVTDGHRLVLLRRMDCQIQAEKQHLATCLPLSSQRYSSGACLQSVRSFKHWRTSTHSLKPSSLQMLK